MSLRARWLLTLVMILTLVSASGVAAEDTKATSEDAPGEETTEEQVIAEESTPQPPPDEVFISKKRLRKKDREANQQNPCAPPPDGDELWAARVRRGVFRTVCNAAEWFDGFFGDPRNLRVDGTSDDQEPLNGRFYMGMGYDELDGFDPSVKLRAKIPLPLLRNRVNALIGRTEIDDFAADRDENFERLPDSLRETDDEWLLGLGYTPVRTTRFRTDIDAGLRIDFPLDPFVRARLRGVFLLSETRLVRLRETLFWRNAKGWGVTSAADFERIFTEDLLFRTALSGTLAQETEGVEYSASMTLYQNLEHGGAMAYRALVFGESDHEVPVEEYGLVVIHRRRFLRDWLFLEIAPGIGWRRLELEEDRELVGSVRVGLEMLFGAERRETRPRPKDRTRR